jgi:hypothetical protein
MRPRPEFLFVNLPVPIAIQGLQRRHRRRNLLLINQMIVIQIERLQQWHHRRRPLRPSLLT